ncbi:Crp/Fnr family transcriptional regulator [Halomonas korlensis]|uniref:cAMP-binding domain of CRP or a regulatory subunit of cAMP-dependent protein kinases n=1 Tax=Halomonas korlensis TaxID=463301 RepID=A0A1I7KHG2_9GAMM|nr:Crp/Fnr family transcriptional regulator [Halomonas korlensis]SFU96871.1 cAMP-binding domain of CRP or a regulatory subunit of cAMP-dependent protein kinases [Halomonas korlensis]
MLESLSPQQNHLLATLPDDVKQRLFPSLEAVTLPLGEVLQQSGKTTHYAYFPTTCIVSLVYELQSGHSAEISLVGNDGMVGIALFMGGQTAVGKGLVQVAGEAFRIDEALFLEEFERHAGLMHHVLLYTQALMTQMAQTAVCNRHHSVQQQLCRWLLMSLDRLSSNQLVMTHDLIASMLGVRREGVTEAAGKLHRLGAINYHRGRIEVIDRAKLEQLSCECYAVVRNEISRLLPGGPS